MAAAWAEAEPKILAHYAEFGRKYAAAAAGGYGSADAITHRLDPENRQYDARFAALWHDAGEHFKESLFNEAHERATEGYISRPVFEKGQHVGDQLVKSDRMLELMLKRHMPEFRENQTVNVKSNGPGLPMPDLSLLSEKGLAALEVLLEEMAIINARDVTPAIPVIATKSEETD